MSRRALALALSGGGLIVISLLGGIFLVPGLPGEASIAVTTLALVGALLAVLGALRAARAMKKGLWEMRQRELNLVRQVESLQRLVDQGTEASVAGTGAATPRASGEDHRDIAAEALGRLSSAQDAIHRRLDSLAGAVYEHDHARRSQDIWAHEIEGSIRSQRDGIGALEKKTGLDRRKDHERFAEIERAVYDSALRTDAVPAVFGPQQARTLASRFSRESDYLRVKPLIEHFEVLDALDLNRLLAASKTYRRYGYMRARAEVAARVAAVEKDGVALALSAEATAEAEFFRDPEAAVPEFSPQKSAYDGAGPIIHVVGKALPETQSGYTLRTQYTVRAQQRRGIDAFVVCQAGAPGGEPDETVENLVDGVRYVMLRGIPRHETTYQQWIADNIDRTAEVVRAERPSVLHAHSDFLNALIATAVGRAFGVPVVYESRGFWEESWLSRTIDTNGLTGTEDDFFRAYGMPEAYSWRQRAEIAARERSDVNLTLGRTMRDHIHQLARPGTLEDDPICFVPNGIDPDAFGDVARDEGLAASLGIEPGDVVIGCISSIVEYEGIDILLRAVLDMSENREAAASRPRLLIVGDGDRLEALRELASQLGLRDAVFTGRVPHAEVLRYYGLIDVFVVPRKPTRVSRLVTPLKPFEALATGRALVVSDVDALREIAEDSGGAVELFPAGDHHALAALLARLLDDPRRRQEMAAVGAAWVRRERTWDANAAVYEQVYRELGWSDRPR